VRGMAQEPFERRVRIPARLHERLNRLAARVSRRLGEPFEATRRAVELSAMTRGLEKLEQEEKER